MKLSDKAMLAAGMDPAAKAAQVQADKTPFRNQYHWGPMGFLSTQAVKRMSYKGWPCKVSELLRSPKRQNQLYGKTSKAKAWQSPHQWGLAADVIHARKGWDVPERFWTDLAAVIKVMDEEYDVRLTHGHYWRFRDSAHFELTSWRDWARRWGKSAPTDEQLSECFAAVMPKVWRQFQQSPAGLICRP